MSSRTPRAHSPEDAALGCILGAFLGDALGAILEMKDEITPQDVEAAKNFVGGGHFDLGPGQITDDSELAICIMQGLKGSPGVLDMDLIAENYARWLISEPRSLGATIAKGLVPLVEDPRASVAIEAAKAHSMKSQSNGGIMRMTPICVWGHKLSDAELVQAAQIEVSMTHSNPIIHQAVGCYALAAAHLINNLGDTQGAYQKAMQHAASYGPDGIIKWFDIIDSRGTLNAKEHGSLAVVGFTYAFKALLEDWSFEDATVFAVSQGGDTDTNAAILGGLVGAKIGLSNLPASWLGKVFTSAVHSSKYVPRPEFLNQSHSLELARSTFSLAPTKLIWVIDAQTYENPSTQPSQGGEYDLNDLALGSVIGAFVGDALGSYIEFQKHIPPALLEQTLKMPGGGPFRLGPGQATDDSELAMCMLRGLIEGNGALNLDRIAHYYGEWIASNPFDIGMTTSQALSGLARGERKASIPLNDSYRANKSSESNGCLMRATPLGVWAHKLSDAQTVEAAIFECSMTHSNQTVQHACACYALAIGHLLKHPGDRQGAYARAKAYALSTNEGGILSWIRNIDSEPPMPGSPKIGWAKIAFTHAFRHLLKGSDYVTAMREVLSLGGDTDTNAAIVGGLIGAAVGYKALPSDWVTKVENYTKYLGGQSRPSFLHQPSVKGQVLSLVQMAPESLSCVIDGVMRTSSSN